MLKLNDVHVSISGIQIIKGVSLEVHQGIHGLIGPNGAGKSTLINSIAGVLRVSKGDIRLNGSVISGLRTDKIARIGISRTFQIPRPVRGVDCQGFVSLTGANLPAIKEVLRRVGLGPKAHLQTNSLTLPELRRLELARALAMQPKVLIMDEVMAGLADVEQKELFEVFRQVAEAGISIIMVEHIMTAVRALCENSTVLSDGKVLVSGPTDTVLKDKRTIQAYLGTSAI
jgi:branched-chain amino acid transport system ATP-binding protein